MRTSEGEDTQQNIIPNDNIFVKHNIKSSRLQQQSTPNKQNNFHYKNKTTTYTQFDTLLKEYLFEVQKLKKYSYRQPKHIVQRYLPNTPPFTIPTPKNTDRKIRKPTFKPTVGRPRLSPYAYSNITRNTAVRELLAQHTADNLFTTNHIYTNTGKKESLDALLNGINSKIWKQSLSNESGRAAQGNNKVKGNGTLDFIQKHEVPVNKKVTYSNFICDFRPLKAEQYRVKLTAGGDTLTYTDDIASPVALMLETKLLINSVISDKKARFLTIDLKYYFLQSIMIEPEFMKIKAKYFPEDIQKHYHISEKIAQDGYVYCRIKEACMA